MKTTKYVFTRTVCRDLFTWNNARRALIIYVLSRCPVYLSGAKAPKCGAISFTGVNHGYVGVELPGDYSSAAAAAAAAASAAASSALLRIMVFINYSAF